MNDLFVTDTHPLLWFAGNKPRKLGRAAKRVFARFESGEVTLLIPNAVAIETWLLSTGGIIETLPSLRAWWNQVGAENLQHVEQTFDDVLAARELVWSHRDVFDRLIVATAHRMGCPLLTADQAITEWGGVEVVW